jgi:hypothetical protein
MPLVTAQQQAQETREQFFDELPATAIEAVLETASKP